MAIKSKQSVSATRRLRAGTTLEDSGSDTKIKPQSTQDLKNNMLPELLIDPEDDEGGSTYTSVTASAKDKPRTTQAQRIAAARRKLRAAETTNVGTMDNIVTDDELGPELEEQADVDLNNNMAPEALFVVAAGEDEDDDWDAPLDAPQDGDDAEDDLDDDVEADEDIAASAGEDAEPAFEIEDGAPEGEVQDLVDIDEVPDDAGSEVVFAAVGGRLSVIRANRIIATMTERRAIKAKVADMYMSDQFQEVTANAMETKGLRKGLKSMGFVMASVNVSTNKVVEARVKAQVSASAGAVKAKAQAQAKIMEQSLAIASVGVNRRFFKGHENPLKDALVAALAQAGVRNGHRLVSAAFAEHGTAYAQSIVTLAQKISAAPEEVRENYVDSLDMTTGDADDVVPVGADADESAVSEWDAADDVEDVDDEFAADIGIEGALATAGVRRQRVTAGVHAPRNQGQYSVQASTILSGDAPLTFRM